MTTLENWGMLLSRLFPPSPEQKNDQLKKSFTTFFAQRLKTVRKAKKLTQQEVAERAGLHLTYVGHLELGKYHPTLFVAWKIARALGVTMNDLLEDFPK